jgi:hypothetical protein
MAQPPNQNNAANTLSQNGTTSQAQVPTQQSFNTILGNLPNLYLMCGKGQLSGDQIEQVSRVRHPPALTS